MPNCTLPFFLCCFIFRCGDSGAVSLYSVVVISDRDFRFSWLAATETATSRTSLKDLATRTSCDIVEKFSTTAAETEKKSEPMVSVYQLLFPPSPSGSCAFALIWKVISISGSTFPTSLVPLCPASFSPFMHLQRRT